MLEGKDEANMQEAIFVQAEEVKMQKEKEENYAVAFYRLGKLQSKGFLDIEMVGKSWRKSWEFFNKKL